MINRTITFVFLLFLGFASFAQDLNLPEDQELSAEAKRRFALSVDNMSIGKYREAADALAWLMTNTPKLYEGMYVNAYKAYEELADKESDPTKQKVLIDSMFTSYNLKDELYGLSDLEINNKAYKYYKFYKDNSDKYEDAIKAFQRAYEKPEELINNNLVGYMDIVRRSFDKNHNFTEEQVLDIYTKINEIIDQRIATGEDVKRLEGYKDVLSRMLTSTITVDCAFIEEKLYPGLKENPNDVNLAKKIFQLSLNAKCSDSEFFMAAIETVHKSEPTSGLAAILGRRFLADKQYEQAEKYFKEAISLETDKAKKAEVTFSLAKAYGLNGKKSQARDEALKAADIDNSVASDAYSFIGNLYMGSFDDCKKGVNQVDDRAIFFAAYDMFIKAKDGDGQARAKAQFPTVGQVFEQNKEEGQSIKVGCWINTSTTIRTRPSN